MSSARRSHTSWQVKKRYNDKSYRRFTGLLRKSPNADGSDDSALIEYIDSHDYSVSDYLKRGVIAYMEEEKRG